MDWLLTFAAITAGATVVTALATFFISLYSRRTMLKNERHHAKSDPYITWSKSISPKGEIVMVHLPKEFQGHFHISRINVKKPRRARLAHPVEQLGPSGGFSDIFPTEGWTRSLVLDEAISARFAVSSPVDTPVSVEITVESSSKRSKYRYTKRLT